MTERSLIIRGAREHNLKNISLEIPRDRLVVITGLSGSGKSSLAFDTIYAEGQRRYVESMSAYARQFIGFMEKPDVDLIEGLSPAVSIEQKTVHKNPRSTVGTVTEIYDYFRLLFARIGVPYCPECGRKISAQSIDQILEKLISFPAGTKLQILAPVIRGKKGSHADVLDRARRKGFARVRIDGGFHTLDEEISLPKTFRHSIDIIVDRLVVKEGIRSRLADSAETALDLGGGLLTVLAGEDEQLFSTSLSCPDCGISIPEMAPRMFSFNSPYGACEKCSGLGFLMRFDPDKIVDDPEKSLLDGAVSVWGNHSWYMEKVHSIARSMGFNENTPWNKLPRETRNVILYGSKGKKLNFELKRSNAEYRYSASFEGVIPNLERRYSETSSEEMRSWMEKYMTYSVCDECGGHRLKKEVLSVRIGDKNIADMTAMSIGKALAYFSSIKLSPVEEQISKQVLKEILGRLRFLNEVGIEYLTLDRSSGSLSGGEAQRIRLATQIGSSLTGVMYVLDEPSIGLHQRDNQKLLASLKKMRDLGNTVIVVEHDEETIREADFVVDLGPGAGVNGGYVLAAGTPAEIEASDKSVTGRFLAGKETIPVPERRREPSAFLEIKGASQNNLKNVDVKLPLGVFAAVTGVSGSGKSTLIMDILYRAASAVIMKSKEVPGNFREITGLENIDKVIDIDQSPIGRTPRSNPATYTGLFGPVRELFASLPESKARGYKPGRFSFNVSGGRCESCQGDGVKKIEMHFLSDVYITCDVCGGKRYSHETLEVRYKGKSISDVLDMTVDEACEFFAAVPAVIPKLKTLQEVGLGYIRLGQPATTLSGGEAQRIKLASELSRRGTGRTLYILDEPTTGLHFADIKCLLAVLQSLVEKGNTVLVIEHNLDMIKSADWITDMGPEGGDGGGTVIAQGTPETVAQTKGSWTGAFLKKILNV